MTQLWPSGIISATVHRCMDDDEIESAPKPHREKREYIKDRFEAIVLGTPGVFCSADFLMFGFHPCTASEYLKRMAAKGDIVKTGRKKRIGQNGQPPWLYRNHFSTGATR